jgi:hypothetical protein
VLAETVAAAAIAAAEDTKGQRDNGWQGGKSESTADFSSAAPRLKSNTP